MNQKQTSQSGLNKVQFSAGEVIYHQNDTGHTMFVILKGEIGLARSNDKYPKKLDKGDFFGELSLLQNVSRYETATALSDTELLTLNSASFVWMFRQNPEISIRILQKMGTQMVQMESELSTLRLSTFATKSNSDKPREAAQTESLTVETGPVDEGITEKRPLGKLVTNKDGKVFYLIDKVSFVGRFDPTTGVHPTIDFTDIDKMKSTSRRHAMIIIEDNIFYLQSEYETNGTFLNGQRIADGHKMPVQTGDKLRFGLIACTFYEGS